MLFEQGPTLSVLVLGGLFLRRLDPFRKRQSASSVGLRLGPALSCLLFADRWRRIGPWHRVASGSDSVLLYCLSPGWAFDRQQFFSCDVLRTRHDRVPCADQQQGIN